MSTRTPEQIEARTARLFAAAQDSIKAIPGVSIGYIGNCSASYDDRSWMIFLPHPGRVGTSGDSLGGFATADRGKLARLAHTLKVGYELGAGK